MYQNDPFRRYSGEFVRIITEKQVSEVRKNNEKLTVSFSNFVKVRQISFKKMRGCVRGG